jgi:hypothetical protein
MKIDTSDCIKQRIKLLEGEIKKLKPYNPETITPEEYSKRTELVGRYLREDIALELMMGNPSTLFDHVDCYFNGERF